MAQSRTPAIPRVSNPDNYLQEIFGVSSSPNVPSFYDFMEKDRGMPMERFTTDQLMVLALIMETSLYASHANMLMRAQATPPAGPPENWQENLTAEDISNGIQAMETRIAELKDLHAAKIAQVA